MIHRTYFSFASLILTALLTFVSATRAQTRPLTPDIPAKFTADTATYDYVKREVMILMRDGVKLYTVIVIPKSAKNAPMILTRTRSSRMLATLPQGDDRNPQTFVPNIFLQGRKSIERRLGGYITCGAESYLELPVTAAVEP